MSQAPQESCPNRQQVLTGVCAHLVADRTFCRRRSPAHLPLCCLRPLLPSASLHLPPTLAHRRTVPVHAQFRPRGPSSPSRPDRSRTVIQRRGLCSGTETGGGGQLEKSTGLSRVSERGRGGVCPRFQLGPCFLFRRSDQADARLFLSRSQRLPPRRRRPLRRRSPTHPPFSPHLPVRLGPSNPTLPAPDRYPPSPRHLRRRHDGHFHRLVRDRTTERGQEVCLSRRARHRRGGLCRCEDARCEIGDGAGSGRERAAGGGATRGLFRS